MGKLITLIGKTMKGKNRVRELGSQWEILRGPKPCLCFNNAEGILIGPVGPNQSEKARWVRVKDDTDFKWTIL